LRVKLLIETNRDPSHSKKVMRANLSVSTSFIIVRLERREELPCLVAEDYATG
jgi:hypothetical protein